VLAFVLASDRADGLRVAAVVVTSHWASTRAGGDRLNAVDLSLGQTCRSYRGLFRWTRANWLFRQAASRLILANAPAGARAGDRGGGAPRPGRGDALQPRLTNDTATLCDLPCSSYLVALATGSHDSRQP